MDTSQATILQRKTKNVKVTYEEQVLMLRAYLVHPCNWFEIIDDIKANLNQLNDRTRDLYNTSSTRQLRDRLANKLKHLMSKTGDTIANQEIRDLVARIRETETRLLQRPESGPAGNHQQPQAAEGDGADMRDQAAAEIASSENEEDAEVEEREDTAETPQPQKRGKKRRRPLGELVRKNHELYNKFMTKKMPKILKELDIIISSDSDE